MALFFVMLGGSLITIGFQWRLYVMDERLKEVKKQNAELINKVNYLAKLVEDQNLRNASLLSSYARGV